ncbi:MAG: heterodisulfide reductase-related iron-sulfur binding cluster [Panacagrimonas sp.]
MQTRFTPEQLRDPHLATSEKAIRTCVHCGFCNATCPTYALLGDELDGPRGRIMLMKDMLEHRRVPSAKTVSHIDKCLSCLSCMTTCPSGVNYMDLVDHARAYIEEKYRRPWHDRVFRSVLAKLLPYPRRFAVALAAGRLFAPLRSLLPSHGIFRSLRAMLELAGRGPSTGSTTAVGGAPPRQHPASPGCASIGEGAVEAKPLLPATRKGRVSFLTGCAEPVLQPGIQQAAMRLVARMGFEMVPAPGQGCCGALVHHLGREAESLDFARANVDAWGRVIDKGGLDAILITASGCGTSVKHYGFILRNDPAYAERARRISELTRDITEWVAQHGLPTPVLQQELSVAYHAACSLQHGQRVREAPRQLLVAAGFRVRDIAESHLCCGSAGVYNILQPEIAAQLRDRKVAAIRATTPDLIATGNIGCLTQLSGGAPAPVVHTVELLDWATGGPEPAAWTRRP